MCVRRRIETAPSRPSPRTIATIPIRSPPVVDAPPPVTGKLLLLLAVTVIADVADPVHAPDAVAVTVYVPGVVGALTTIDAEPLASVTAEPTVVLPIVKVTVAPAQKPAAVRVIEAPGSGAELLDDTVGDPGGYAACVVAACIPRLAMHTINRASRRLMSHPRRPDMY